ncbi:hypothetical protein Q9Q99_08750 [Curtobacterium flaccumfaciens]|nr:hypothetical protein Q9Q99_08750 [Curtobacterium flaccumfaciens]
MDGTCDPLKPRFRGLGDGADGHCTAINRPDVTTIYPPMAQLWFAAVRFFVPATAQYLPFQVAGLLVSLGVTIGLVVVLRRIGRPTWWAALWAWSPLVASEAVTNSHVDVVGAALATAGVVLSSRSAGRSGVGSRSGPRPRRSSSRRSCTHRCSAAGGRGGRSRSASRCSDCSTCRTC